MRILLTGSKGQVGSALEQTLGPIGDVVALERSSLDLSDLNAIPGKISEIKPDLIVNAAAYTAVDRAESEREAAFAVNSSAVRVLAEEARKLDALLIHFSTDYVFDGEKAGAYTEEDAPRPLNVYGESKLAGERAVAAVGCRHFIFRTSWVYAPGGRNFLNAILAAARTRPELRVVDDQRGAPTSSAAIAASVARVLSNPEFGSKPSGTYHMSAAGETTWHGFATVILAAKGLKTPVVAIRSEEYPAAAKRPKNSLLDSSKLQRTFGVALPDWRQGLREVSSKISLL